MSMFTHRRTALTTRPTNSTLGPTVMYLVALLICGSNGIVASYINLPSYQIVFFRMLLGALFLGVLLLITHSKPDWRSVCSGHYCLRPTGKWELASQRSSTIAVPSS